MREQFPKPKEMTDEEHIGKSLANMWSGLGGLLDGHRSYFESHGKVKEVEDIIMRLHRLEPQVIRDENKDKE